MLGIYIPDARGDVNASAYVTNGQDCAESMPKLDANERLEAGDIVAVVGGKVTKPEHLNGTNASLYMIVTDGAGVTGNGLCPDEKCVAVSFTGQVRTKVSDAVREGDYVLADGRSVGCTKPKDEVTFDDYKKKVVGVALEGKTAIARR